MSKVSQERASYWDKFYAGRTSAVKTPPPSQFAAFTAQEVANFNHIVDVGCGNGRDSLFFVRHGFQVVGFDMSESAVKAATEGAEAEGLSGVSFVQGDVAGPALAELISELGENPLCVYARFFLHAITEDEQARFVGALSEQLKPGDIVAVEYRTTKDQHLAKVADIHYRRYQDAKDLHTEMAAASFELLYEAEGFGFAKYKSEDAHVARGVYRKTRPRS